MESWPAVAWVLLLTINMDLLKSLHTRDFSEKDIIFLHPSSTPFPGGFKCFTCEDAQDNFECNRWAPDMYCPREASYCFTRHTIDVEGNSVSVTKRCVLQEDCLFTGCIETDPGAKKVCTACCKGNICNLAVPWNESDSILSMGSPFSGTVGLSQRLPLTFSLIGTFTVFSCGV